MACASQMPQTASACGEETGRKTEQQMRQVTQGGEQKAKQQIWQEAQGK